MITMGQMIDAPRSLSDDATRRYGVRRGERRLTDRANP